MALRQAGVLHPGPVGAVRKLHAAGEPVRGRGQTGGERSGQPGAQGFHHP